MAGINQVSSSKVTMRRTCMTSEDEDEFLPLYIESIADAINPIVFNYKFTK